MLSRGAGAVASVDNAVAGYGCSRCVRLRSELLVLRLLLTVTRGRERYWQSQHRRGAVSGRCRTGAHNRAPIRGWRPSSRGSSVNSRVSLGGAGSPRAANPGTRARGADPLCRGPWVRMDNNARERSLRPPVVRQKVSFDSHSVSGARLSPQLGSAFGPLALANINLRHCALVHLVATCGRAPAGKLGAFTSALSGSFHPALTLVALEAWHRPAMRRCAARAVPRDTIRWSAILRTIARGGPWARQSTQRQDRVAARPKERRHDHADPAGQTELLFLPACDVDTDVQQIRIVFEGLPGHVPTALATIDLDDAPSICDKLNRQLGLDRLP